MLVKSRFLALLLVIVPAAGVRGGTTIDELRREVDELRRQLNENQSRPVKPVSKKTFDVIVGRYGPNVGVKTNTGKLEIGGLLQIWDTNYLLKDHLDVFGNRSNTVGFAGTDAALDNDGTRIRRAEMKFSLDLQENIKGVIMFDPAHEETSYPAMPSNQGLFKAKAFYAPQFDALYGPGLGSTKEVAAVQKGAGAAPFLLQDAYLNWYGLVPHHDFAIGQFKPRLGEEGVRGSGFLDFAERAMITQFNDQRDLGLQVHGTWWNDRIQYWVGAFNGAGDLFGTAGQFANRADDNSQKDFLSTVLVRPLWQNDPWGTLEAGFSGQWGEHGYLNSAANIIQNPANSSNRCRTAAIRQAAWFRYKPLGAVHGFWLRGEWGSQKDRAAPFSVDALALGSGPYGEQITPHPMVRQGWYLALGYKLSDSVFADRLDKNGFWNSLLKPVEFVFREESFQNIVMESLVRPDTETDLFKSQVLTAGVNYYILGYNRRVQVNFMLVDEPEDRMRGLREVKNNVLLFTYQFLF